MNARIARNNSRRGFLYAEDFSSLQFQKDTSFLFLFMQRDENLFSDYKPWNKKKIWTFKLKYRIPVLLNPLTPSQVTEEGKG